MSILSRVPGRLRSRPNRRAFGLSISLVVASLGLASTAVAGKPVDLLPDLRMLLPTRLTVCAAPTSGTFQTENCPPPTADDRWLRFDSVLLNVGVGTFRVVATRDSTAEDHMHAVQRIHRSDGTWLTVPTDAVLAWAQAEDGHPHWHTQGMERYRLFKLPNPFSDGAAVGVKHGYCFFDGLFLRPTLPFARPSPRYSFYSCGQPGGSQDALRLVVGLSVGWGDEYPWNYAGQRIDLAGVPDGDYLVCLTADPLSQFVELSDRNNESWARISLTTTTSPNYKVRVKVLASGKTRCKRQVPYPIEDLGRS